jgi:hypothetical protein
MTKPAGSIWATLHLDHAGSRYCGVGRDRFPSHRGGLLIENLGAPSIVDRFELPGDDVDFAEQLRDLSKAVASRLVSLAPDRVVVRRADFPPAGSRKEAPKLRLMAEGAVAAAAREEVVATFIGTGQEIGSWDGRGKDAVEGNAKAMVKAAGLPVTKWTQAGLAALGALAKS